MRDYKKKVLPRIWKYFFYGLKLNVHQICGGHALYLGDNTVLCVVYILTKQGVKTSLPGGLLPMKKRTLFMLYMNI